MKKILILYFIFSFIFACNNEKKDNKRFNDLNLKISEKILTEKILKEKTVEELRILRNEIFARKGYVFKDSILNKHFSHKDWYKPNKNANIVLNDIEKKNIKLIKSIEKKLKPFEIPDGYEILNTISLDFDKDQVKDIIQLVKNTKSNYFEQFIFIYLTKTKTLQKIDLGLEDEFNQTQAFINVENGFLKFEYTIPGTGLFNYIHYLTYNSKIENFQLSSYSTSSRIMYGQISKEYNLINGIYKVTKEASTIINPNKMITTRSIGKQESKLITPDLINGKLYAYLDNIGNEFDEERYSDYYGEFIDCREAIVQKLALDFEYGKNNYLGQYQIFESQIKNFIQSINTDEMLKYGVDNYSRNYTLHRDWNLNYIEEDECEDELFIIFNTKKNTFRIQINNCSLYKEGGENIETAEESIMFEYIIEKNCTYKFDKISGAG